MTRDRQGLTACATGLTLLVAMTPAHASIHEQLPVEAQPRAAPPELAMPAPSTIPVRGVQPPAALRSSAPRAVTAPPIGTVPIAPVQSPRIQTAPPLPQPVPTVAQLDYAPELSTRHIDRGQPRKLPVGMLITGISTLALGYVASAVAGIAALQRSKQQPRIPGSDGSTSFIPTNERKYGSRMLVPVVGPLSAPEYGRDINSSIFAVFSGAAQLAGLSLALVGSLKYANAKKLRDARTNNISLFATPTGAGLHGSF